MDHTTQLLIIRNKLRLSPLTELIFCLQHTWCHYTGLGNYTLRPQIRQLPQRLLILNAQRCVRNTALIARLCLKLQSFPIRLHNEALALGLLHLLCKALLRTSLSIWLQVPLHDFLIQTLLNLISHAQNLLHFL